MLLGFAPAERYPFYESDRQGQASPRLIAWAVTPWRSALLSR